jgi:phytanoyl-CoA hydroxylase
MGTTTDSAKPLSSTKGKGSGVPVTGALVSREHLDHYARHGFAVLRGIVPRQRLDEARRIIEPWVSHFVDKWKAEGLVTRDYSELDFWNRFLAAWRDAGKPHFRRQPNRFLIRPEMYHLIRSSSFLDIAAAFIGTPELSMHGIFNARPQLPGCKDTLTPWHQDSQYWSPRLSQPLPGRFAGAKLDYGDEPDVEGKTHVMTLWFPLQPVDASSGCLQVFSKEETGDRAFEPFEYEFARTGFLGLTPADIAAHTPIRIAMEPGDALVFRQRTPHAAAPNDAGRIRWSIDIRFEATETATVVGRKWGFVAQSLRDPHSVTPLEAWLAKRPFTTDDPG